MAKWDNEILAAMAVLGRPAMTGEIWDAAHAAGVPRSSAMAFISQVPIAARRGVLRKIGKNAKGRPLYAAAEKVPQMQHD